MSRSVGEFTLVGHLGEGSFATVFLARQRDTQKEFAMKAISRSRLQGKLQENLESEISILKSFRHGNIVELYDIKKTERHIYLVLEYCGGGDLRALIRKEGRLAEHSARHFMRHLGSGLHFLWSKSLVHRDLKPQNLLLTGAGLDATLKIADFGFARHLAKASMAETICGSPLYMAPEILQGHKYGAKADLWSVGAILFEMLAGKPPFGGANQIQLLANIRRGPTPAARDGFYPMPEGVNRPGRACNDLLCRLLVPDPQHRASFRDFFESDVLRPAPAPSADAATAGAGSSPSQRSDSRRSSFERSQGGGQIESSLSAAAAATMGGGGGAAAASPVGVGVAVARKVGEGRHPDRDAVVAYSSSGHRASASQARGDEVQRSPRAVAGGGGGGSRAQGQEQVRGSWWPLAGWRWGGGGGGGGGRQDGPGSRVNDMDDDGRFMPLIRTFSDPPVAVHQQRNRLQTPPSRGRAGGGFGGGGGGGGGEYPGQQSAGSAARSSRGQWGAPQQQAAAATPSRPSLTPPSPAQGSSSSRRGSREGHHPTPTRQNSFPSRGGGGGGGGGDGDVGGGSGKVNRQHQHYHQHSQRNDRENEAYLPPGDAGVSGSPGHPSPQWPRYGDADADIAPYRSNQPQRHHQQGPSSAPEISYMGHAASRARERAAAAAAAAAAGLRGVAFSLAGDSPRRMSGEVGQPQAAPGGGAARESARGGQRAAVPKREDIATSGGGGSGSRDVRGSSRHAHSAPQESGGRALEPSHGGGSNTVGGQQQQQQLAVATAAAAAPTASVTAVTVASASGAVTTGENLQALGSAPPEKYPVQLAAMVIAHRQRLWGGMMTTAVAAPGAVSSAAGVAGLTYANGLQTDAVGSAAGFVGAGLEGGGLRTRFGQESFPQKHYQQHHHQQQQQQQQQGGGGGPTEGDDGSGGSDDFVLVDGTLSDTVSGGGAGGGGGNMHTAYRLGGGGGIRAPWPPD